MANSGIVTQITYFLLELWNCLTFSILILSGLEVRLKQPKAMFPGLDRQKSRGGLHDPSHVSPVRHGLKDTRHHKRDDLRPKLRLLQSPGLCISLSRMETGQSRLFLSDSQELCLRET